MPARSVFLAEGEIHVRDALRLMFENQDGFVISGEASHAESLLAQVCQKPPTLLLLDWHLPGIHPPRLVRTLRAHCPKTCVLVTSVQPEQARNAFELGVNGYLLKQLPPDQFFGALVAALEKFEEGK